MNFFRRGVFIVPATILLSAVLGGIFGPHVGAQAGSSDERVKKTITSLTTVLDTVEKNYADPVSTEKAIYNGAIQFLNGTLCFLLGRHFNESETLASSRIAIGDHFGRLYSATSSKGLLQG